MNPKKELMQRRSFRWLIGSGVVTMALVVAACVFFGVHSPRDVFAYVEMSREAHPVWKDLAWHRLYAGQDLDEAIAVSKPMSVRCYGRFVELNYQEFSYTGVTVLACDGKLAVANVWSCV